MIVLKRATASKMRFVSAITTMRLREFSKKNDNDASSDEGTQKVDKPQVISEAAEPKEESAAERLNKLLASMQTKDTHASSVKHTDGPRPGETHKKRKEELKRAAKSKDIFEAAKNVANLMGTEEHKKQTESELLAKLLGQTGNNSAAAQNGDDKIKSPEEHLNLSELIVGMKIDRSQPTQELTRSDFVRRTMAASLQNRKQPRYQTKYTQREAESYSGSVNLFGGEPLGIFKQPETLIEMDDILKTWSKLQQHELKLEVMHPAANYFEKMIRWTDQGKVWKFPIDNEQGLLEEVDVDFSEHIFLEQHLEAWCPTKGPIRHFMELVCVGLSKNPYITAKEKKEHILWFRDYFESKRDVLKDLMSTKAMEKATAVKKEINA